MKVIDDLRRDGIALLPTALAPSRIKMVAAHLRASPCYDGHVKVYGDGVPRPFAEASRMFPVWCHDPAAVLSAPFIWDLILALMPTAAVYLEAPPRLYSVNAFWSRPDDGPPRQHLQTWHRDRDDERFLAMFVYGSDVLHEDDGPHLYRRGTQGGRDVNEPVDVEVMGTAGTVFLADTSGMHVGLQPMRGQRLLLWARWGVSERPLAYDIDATTPAPRTVLGDGYPSDPVARDLIKLVVA